MKKRNFFMFMRKNVVFLLLIVFLCAPTDVNATPSSTRITAESNRSKAGNRFLKKGKQWYYQQKNGTRHKINLSSDCAILIDAESGEVLYEKNADLHHGNASTTKIMTCILALEECSMWEEVEVSAYAASQEPTKLYMREGEHFYLGNLLYSLMLPSHNDTAVAIAEHICDSTKEFVSLMNKKAKKLGCTSTHFATPTGLDAGYNHYTTARDLSKIAQYAWQIPNFRKIVGRKKKSIVSLEGRTYTLRTTNELYGEVPGLCGMKTGYTRKAGHCFAGVVKARNGHTYISITLGGPTSAKRWTDSKKLLNYAYRLS